MRTNLLRTFPILKLSRCDVVTLSIYSTSEQPRQQDPPADNETDVLWLPPLPESKIGESVNGRVAEWTPDKPADDIAATCSVEQNCTLTPPDVDMPSSNDAVVTASSDAPLADKGNDCAVQSAAAVENHQPEVTCTLELIRRGVKLRKTVSLDRSAPLLN